MRSVIRRTQQATTPTSTAGREVEMKGCAELPDNGNETAGGRLAPALPVADGLASQDRYAERVSPRRSASRYWLRSRAVSLAPATLSR